MEKTKEIRNFFYGQYFSEGVKITVGCIVPVLVSASLGYFSIGTLISLGALLVGLSDTPGAPSHRRLGMLSTALLCMLTYVIIIHVNFSVALTTIVVALLSFSFAMLAVFNARAATVGSMCTLMMLFNVHHELVDMEKWMYLIYIAIGGSWYMLISMSILQIRPYRVAQQELSESIRHVADYIRLKANFYDPKIDIDKNYLKLIEKQVEVHKHQELVRDILFQSKRSIKDTTKIGRFLTLIFSDIVDLFEQSMTTQYDYNAIKTTYGQYGVLVPFKDVLVKLTHEMDNMAYAINANRMPKPIYSFESDIHDLRDEVEKLDKLSINTIPLKKIIINIRGIVKYLEDIYSYSSTKISDIPRQEIDSASQFITRDQIDWKKFRNNLSLESSVFRHALRMALVLSGTYLTLSLIDFNPNGIYWTLLTIMVILKPGFGLTQERNLQRLIGTVVGGIIGATIVFTIHDPAIRFVLLIFFFLTAYSLFRINYIIAVMFMTPYVLIMLSFNGMNTFEMAKERIFDTFLGGVIAFLSNYLIFPNWESTQFRGNMRSLLLANYNYIAQAVQILGGENLSRTAYKLARKEVYIASANMGSTFQRMLTEPKWRQKYTKEVNRFVILNHIFSSYSANLLTQVNQADISTFSKEHVKLLKRILSDLEKAIVLLPSPDELQHDFKTNEHLPTFPEPTVDEEEHRLITEQLQFLSKISGDLHRVTQELIARSAAIAEDEKIKAING
ncbi:FUSC family protein [Sphingobacterium paludis]|uniref:Putative membrane protein YccC n=1 Tax=Sphingobacterium paludis TaxID=1476465 RepID=A0A4V3E2I1_9SPHI|nr:FUSC family membrane protein [Sphingobacterium paludis]TDS17278.1 putative membrane protein YccC [Sphingobacterium paludis]